MIPYKNNYLGLNDYFFNNMYLIVFSSTIMIDVTAIKLLTFNIHHKFAGRK